MILIEPDPSVRDALVQLLEGVGWRVNCQDNCLALDELARKTSAVALISESSLPDCNPHDVLVRCSEHGLPVIFTGHDLPLQGAVDLIRQGATDFLDKPFPQTRLLDLLEQLQIRQESTVR